MCLHHWEKLQVGYKGSKAPPRAWESPNFLQQGQETSCGLWWAEQFITVCIKRKKAVNLHSLFLISCKDLWKFSSCKIQQEGHGGIHTRQDQTEQEAFPKSWKMIREGLIPAFPRHQAVCLVSSSSSICVFQTFCSARGHLRPRFLV